MQKRLDNKKASRMKKVGIVPAAGASGAKTGGRRARMGFEGRNAGFIN